MDTSNAFSSLCDDFYVDMYVNTELELPARRDTVLAFFERIQKQYPSMGYFYRGDNGAYCLEEGRNTGQYRWVALEMDRLGSGVVNPAAFEDAYSQDRFILDLMPYMLSVSHLDIDSLDVVFAMDFDCADGHDEVIAEALSATRLGCLRDLLGAKTIDFSPSMVVALSDDCRTQARICLESRTSIYDPDKQRQCLDEPITLSLSIRRYPSNTEKFDALKSFENQCRLAEELMAEKIVPNLIQPLISVIAQRRLS
jgi:hypothetical protein